MLGPTVLNGGGEKRMGHLLTWGDGHKAQPPGLFRPLLPGNLRMRGFRHGQGTAQGTLLALV